ncbi:putative aminoacrylate hydrolase RutD [Phytophthora citrophthora]|uniref:Aminoacrylate hydrolase RutD n=1 Tax=Phytophthora citrophthora TaxID=4793 RepID=A0AAD9GMG7_9STRA|nr:putative aminoacrylate hydrolase RutD [Phytophthora citrophthora]
MVLPLLEQHMMSKYAASRAYTPDIVKKVKVATGITMGYLIQEVGTCSDEIRLVLVGGHSSRKEEWAPVVGNLLTQWEARDCGKTLKVLTFDNRGVGDSDAPCGMYSTSGMAKDTLALLDVIGWRTAHIAGTSLGGMISQEIALAAPDRVQSLSLIATSSGSFMPDTSAYSSIFTTMTSRDPSKVTNAILAFLYPEPFLTSKITMRNVFFKYHRNMVATFAPPSLSGALGQSTAAMLHSVSTRKLHKIRDRGFPILIVGATLDKCINISHALHFKKELASSHTRVAIYEDAGHGCLLQHLDELTHELLKVIQSA